VKVVPLVFIVFFVGCGLFDMPQEFVERLDQIAAQQDVDQNRRAALSDGLLGMTNPDQISAVKDEIQEIRSRLMAIPMEIAELTTLALEAVDAKREKAMVVGKSIFESIGGGMTAIGIPGGGLAAWGLTAALGTLIGRKKKNAVAA